MDLLCTDSVSRSAEKSKSNALAALVIPCGTACTHTPGWCCRGENLRERITTLLKMTAPARTEEKGDISGPADCAQREQMLEVNGALVKGRKSKSSNTWNGHFSQTILYLKCTRFNPS